MTAKRAMQKIQRSRKRTFAYKKKGESNFLKILHTYNMHGPDVDNADSYKLFYEEKAFTIHIFVIFVVSIVHILCSSLITF